MKTPRERKEHIIRQGYMDGLAGRDRNPSKRWPRRVREDYEAGYKEGLAKSTV